MCQSGTLKRNHKMHICRFYITRSSRRSRSACLQYQRARPCLAFWPESFPRANVAAAPGSKTSNNCLHFEIMVAGTKARSDTIRAARRTPLLLPSMRSRSRSPQPCSSAQRAPISMAPYRAASRAIDPLLPTSAGISPYKASASECCIGSRCEASCATARNIEPTPPPTRGLDEDCTGGCCCYCCLHRYCSGAECGSRRIGHCSRGTEET